MRTLSWDGSLLEKVVWEAGERFSATNLRW